MARRRTSLGSPPALHRTLARDSLNKARAAVDKLNREDGCKRALTHYENWAVHANLAVEHVAAAGLPRSAVQMRDELPKLREELSRRVVALCRFEGRREIIENRKWVD